MKASLLLGMLLLPGAAIAQSQAATEIQVDENIGGTSAEIKFVDRNDSSRYYVTLHENAPHIFNEPDVPRFALLGKEGRFYMGIGANIKGVVDYDLGHPVSNPNDFAPSQIPMHIAPGNGGQFKISAQQSSIYLNVVALPGTKNQLGAYVSINFRNDNYGPRLNHAYLRYYGILAGYTHSIFSDVSTSPATIDFLGPNGLAAAKHGMIAWEPYFGKNKEWRAGVAIDMPHESYTENLHTVNVSQRVPDIPFYIQRSWADGAGRIRLSGIIRNLYYRNETAERNVDKFGWGVKLSGTMPIVGGLSAYYQGAYGIGMANYIQDLGGLGMDLMPDASNPSRLKATKAWGGFAALQYTFSPRFFCTAIYSQVRTYVDRYNDSLSPWGDKYKYGQYILGNLFYNINSIAQLGVEYIYGRRVNYDGSQAHDNRLEAMIMVSF